MRRGLMAWNTDEVPASALAERLTRLRAAMRAQNLDALIMYTNFPRPSAVTWVTAFTPYWADALLYVPREGEPVFATALSKRVAKWINSVKPVGELVNTMRPGKTVGERVAADPTIKRIGILEMDALPNGLYEDLTEAAPQVVLVEGGKAFAEARRVIDDAERGLLAKANTIATDALAQVDVATMRDAGAVVGAVEKAARLAGAEEAYVHIAVDLAERAAFARVSGAAPLGSRFAVRASVAYKGIWVRRARTFSQDAADRDADAWFAQALAGLKPGQPFSAQFVHPDIEGYIAESCVGSYPLEKVSETGGDVAFAEGSLAVVTARLLLPHGPWIGAAPVIVGGQGNAALRAA